MSDLATVQRALGAAQREGAHSADAVLVAGDSTEARVRGEEIDFVKQARERTLGIRVFVEGKGGLQSAITSTSDLSETAVERLAADSVALARETAADPSAGLPTGGFAESIPDLALFDPADRGLAVDPLIASAKSAEAAARATDPRIVNSEGSEASSEFNRVAYANSAGFEGEYESAGHSVMANPIASENGAMQSDYWYSVARRIAALESPAAVGRRAAERVLGQLGAKPVPTCEVPVVFDALTARSLLGQLVSCLSGYAIYRGSSFLAGRLGETIASPQVTVIDDGLRPGGLGSKPFDGEGQPTRRKTLVQDGLLESYLLDCYSARKLEMETTGNASRSASSAPGVAATNLWLEPGPQSEQAIVGALDRGLYVTGMFGHGFNPVTGDFSRGARGFWVEHGELVHPVEEITVAGNLGQMLLDVDAIADEVLWIGGVAAPALRVANLTVAGA